MCDRERLRELEHEVDRFGWHDFELDTPTEGDLVIATDGEARWMTIYTPFLDHMTWYFGNRMHTATHWHYVLDLPEKFRKPSAPDPDEPKF